MMRVRLKDIADATGVSIGTVSRVLNNSDWRIAKATREKVKRAADALGYVPNVAAQTLRTNRTNTIAALTDSLVTTPFGYQLVSGLQEEVAAAGFLLMILNTGESKDQRERAIETVRGHHAQGIILGAMYHRHIDAGGLPLDIPFVAVNGIVDNSDAASFVPNEREGAIAATSHLMDYGHRDIVHLTEVRTDGLARDLRIQGFEEALRRSSARGRVVEVAQLHGETRSTSAERATMELLASPCRPSAIFAFSDLMAVGVIRAARRCGLSIPTDLSLVGFDDQTFVADEASPPLTTVRLPHEEMGKIAAKKLVSMLSVGHMSENASVGAHLVPCPLISRESVAPPIS